MQNQIRVLKTYGFVLFMGVGAFFPYMFLYIRELGFSKTQIGLLGALGPLVMLIVQPFWGWISDRTGKPHLISVILALGIALSISLLLTARSFLNVALFLGLFNVFYSSLIPIYDSIIIRAIDNTEVSYGQVRWLGSLSFALTAFIVGRIIERTYVSISLKLYIFIALLLAIIAFKLPIVGTKNSSSEKKIKIWPLLKNRQFIIFLMASTLVIGSNALNYTFYPFLFKELGGGEGLLGLAMLIAAFAEMPFFFFSARLHKRFSLERLLLVAFGVTAIRWFLYSIAISAYQLLVIQLLHSLTFGLLYSSAVVYVSRLTPGQLKSSGQTLFWAAGYGLGNMVGNIVGGWIYEKYSVQFLFGTGSVAAFIGALLFLFGTVLRKEIKRSI